MGNKVVALNQKDVSVRIRILADSTGVPNTGVNNSTTGLDIYYQRGENGAAVSGGVSTSDLSSAGAPHTDWAFVHVTDGWYRVDLPDAAFAEGVGSTLCGITADSFTGVSVTVDIEPLFKYHGNPTTVVSTTRTRFPSGTTPLKGDRILVANGTGEPGNMVLVTSVSAEEAVHPAFETGISATTTNITLISGDSISADGGINCDVSASTLATPADVTANTSAVVAAASLATSADLAAVTSSVVALTTAGVNVTAVNDITVTGAGTSASPWGP